MEVQRQNHVFDLEHFLDFFNLPKIQKIEQDIIIEMSQRIERFNKKSQLHKLYKKIATNGIYMFDKMGLSGRKMTMMACLNKKIFNISPHLIYGDEIWDEIALEEILKKDILALTKREWYELVDKLRIPHDEIVKYVK